MKMHPSRRPCLLALAALALACIPCPAGEMAAVSRVGPFTNDTAFFEFPYEPFAPCSLSNALSGAFCGDSDGGPGSDVLLWIRPGETNAAVFCGSAWETVLGDGLVAAGDIFAFARCDSEEASLFLLGLVPRTLSLLPPPPPGSPSIGSLSADAQRARVCVSSSGPVDLFSADSPGPTNVPPSGWVHVARAPASFSISDGLPGADSTRFYAVSSPFLDSDLDGLGDLAERLVHGTDPHLADTDGDGCPDMAELLRGTSPLVPDAPPATLFSEGFERPLVVPGPLSGQNGWAAAAGANVEETPLASGAACLRLSSGEGASASHAVAFPPGVSWLEAKVLTEPAAEPPPASGCIGVFFDFLGHPVALDGTAWRTNRAVSVEAESWARLAARIDRDAGEWDLYLDGAIVFRSLRTGPAAPSELAFGGGDGLVDDVSVSTSRPAGLSSDGDALPDEWEIAHFATLERDGSQDFDSDGLSDLEEFALGTDPLLADTDGDSMPDGREAAFGLNPIDPSDAALDPDGDGVSNLEEFALGLDPGSFEPDPRLRRPGLLASFWRTPGKLGAMPDFGSLMPSHSAVAARLDFPGQGWVPGVTPFGTNFACRLEGYLLVPADGKCTFWLKSNAGARMYIDGALALDDGEAHSAHTVSASPTLERGYRRVEIDFYANSSPGYLLLEWKPPGGERAKVPASALCHLPPAPDPWFGPGVDVEFHSFPSALSEMPALDGHAPCAARVWDRLDVRATQSAWEDGLPADRFAASAEGLLFVPVSARYEISLSSNEGSSLILDGVPLVDNGGLHGMRARTAVLPLAAGYHPFRVEYFENTGSAGLSLGWSCRGCVSEPVPARFLFRRPAVMDTDGDGMPDWWEAERGLDPLDPSDAAADPDGDGLSNLAECRAWGDPRSPDTDGDGMPDAWEAANGTCPFLADALDDPDGDGLANVEEMRFGTDPLAPDTDGDGASDGAEVRNVRGNPLAADIAWSPIPAGPTVPGASFTSSTGTWRTDDSGTVFAAERAGSLTWRLTVPEGGADALALSVGQHNLYAKIFTFDLSLKVDGVFVTRELVSAQYGEKGEVYFFLPEIPHGEYEFTVTWHNWEVNTFLSVYDLRFVKFGGPDSNGDGIADWKEHRASTSSAMDALPCESLVSPLCIEGRDIWRDVLEINVDYPESNAVFTAVKTIGDGFYADIPLPLDGSAVVSMKDRSVSGSFPVAWKNFDVFAENYTTNALLVRAGDSLKIAPHEEGESEITISISNGENSWIALTNWTASSSMPYCFETNGLYLVEVSRRGIFSSRTGYALVDAVSSRFPMRNPAILMDMPQKLSCPDLSPRNILEHDSELKLDAEIRTKGVELSLFTSADRDLGMVSRLAEGGAISDAVQVTPIWADNGTYYRVAENCADGSQLIVVSLLFGAVAENMTIELEIFVSGVTFEDGSRFKTLTAKDLDENGHYTIRFIRARGVTTSVCHRTYIYQDGKLMYTNK